MSQNLAEMGLAADPNKAVPIRKRGPRVSGAGRAPCSVWAQGAARWMEPS